MANIEVCGNEIVPLPKIRAGTMFGSGKIQELKAKFAVDLIATYFGKVVALWIEVEVLDLVLSIIKCGGFART